MLAKQNELFPLARKQCRPMNIAYSVLAWVTSGPILCLASKIHISPNVVFVVKWPSISDNYWVVYIVIQVSGSLIILDIK